MRLHTVICEECALVFTNPRPKREFYEEFYEGHYHALYGERRDSPTGRAALRRFNAAAEFRVRYYRHWLRHDMRLLEIGSGTGAFLTAVQQAFPEATLRGLEPSSDVAARARGTVGGAVDAVPIESAPERARGCDVVVMFHVLEHLLDPMEVLVAIGERMAPGGCLLIEVPNVIGPWRGIGMFHIAHTCAFSPRTLARIVGRAGFRVEWCDDTDHPGLESSVFLVARRTLADDRSEIRDRALPEELEETVRWIRHRTRSALLGRLKKRLLLDFRAVRDLLAVRADG